MKTKIQGLTINIEQFEFEDGSDSNLAQAIENEQLIIQKVKSLQDGFEILSNEFKKIKDGTETG